jgi:hypothetical protein
MAFDWGDYLDLARTLETDKVSSFQEAALRSAVSRAYYAAYCYARNYASDREGLLLANKPSDHGLVKRHHLKKGRADLASELEDLRQWRNTCDYDDELSGDIRLLVKNAIQNAQDIIEECKSL